MPQNPTPAAAGDTNPTTNLTPELERLRTQYDQLDKTLDEVMTERDAHHDALDRFALAVAPEEVIGEHSSGNNPWANAFELVTPAAEVDALRARIAELEQQLAASQSTAKQLLRKAASAPSQREAGAL
ncbi:hypothetical protein ACIA9I_12115 [Streptomyces anulatus]